ncbi:glycosyltransferase family 1 protein [Alteribacter populi]|uniref:glycosyltransferase family 1 protein n=1 Tax=Alteribacter populi TaxID=2011011 RepID=UPI000BBABB3D|nr:glycosyltransferase family 1 protein [Alteribacter populi]
MGGPIRVLHVVVNMNRGGAETLLMNLYRNVDRSKVQFDFLTCKKGVFDDEIIQLGGIIHRIPYISESGHFGFKKALQRFFESHSEYRIVHSHLDKMSGIVLNTAKESNIPIRIAHSHNTNSEGKTAAKLYKWYIGNYILKSATHLLACSNAAAKWLFKNEIGRVQVLKNGIESDNFTYSQDQRKKIRGELELKKDDFVIGHVGRFNHQKNHDFLIDVFAQINQAIPQSKLILVGDGQLREKMEKKILKLNLNKQVFVIGVRSDISQLLQGFDLFMFPSLHEGLPVTLIEAQAAGLPCVVSDVITKEVDMEVNLVEFVSITNKAQWIDKVIEIAEGPLRRVEAKSNLSKKGYDIKNTAEWTQMFYLSV